MSTKTVTSSELRANVKQVLNEVEYGSENYIIEKFGTPSAAIISIEDFQFFQAISAIVDEVERKNAREAEKGNMVGNQEALNNQHPDDTGEVDRKSMSQSEMVESLMKLLDDSEQIPEAAANYMRNNIIGKLLATLQYLEGQVSRLEAEFGIRQEGAGEEAANEEKVMGPHGEHWGQFVGAFADEEWERPEQGTLEVREAW